VIDVGARSLGGGGHVEDGLFKAWYNFNVHVGVASSMHLWIRGWGLDWR
jgi:hypothetical protein